MLSAKIGGSFPVIRDQAKTRLSTFVVDPEILEFGHKGSRILERIICVLQPIGQIHQAIAVRHLGMQSNSGKDDQTVFRFAIEL
jgi:hypothetical protein